MDDLPYEPVLRDRMDERTRLDRRKLKTDAPARARELAALGLPLASIAAGIGVHRATLHRWRREAGPEGPERAVCDAIQDGYRQGEQALVEKLHKVAADGDTRSATWLLTHSPSWRESWSDAAAVRSAVQLSQKRMAEVIAVCPVLSNEQRQYLYLAMAAAGEGNHPDGQDYVPQGRKLLLEWLADQDPEEPSLKSST